MKIQFFSKILTTASFLILLSCSSNQIETDGVIAIDVLKALDNPQPFKLSMMVDDIEVIELESNRDSFFHNSGGIRVGNKFILVCFRYEKIY